jgi:hypothetical protein
MSVNPHVSEESRALAVLINKNCNGKMHKNKLFAEKLSVRIFKL